MKIYSGSIGLVRRLTASVAFVIVSLLLMTSSAYGLAFTLSQIGGTAENGRGFVGDTIVVAVEFTIAEDELMLATFPTLWWDQAGGNVLDIVSAVEGFGGSLGPYAFTPINSRYLLTNSGERTGRIDRSFEDGNNFLDNAIGTTLMIGFEVIHPFFDDDQLLREIIANGAPGPASFRLGTATFRLSDRGSTTIGFFRDPNSTFRTLVSGARGIEFNADEIEFNDIPVSGIGFGALNIVVVPEPSTALLLGAGLAGLAIKRRSGQDARRSQTAEPAAVGSKGSLALP
jgi:hypothetical protein